ncbi:hypothetical protein FDA48_06280 [Clostridium botulinum]|nr:hypothetical protein [Clostridium botulinum]
MEFAWNTQKNGMTPKRINSIHSEAPKYLQEKGFDVTRGLGKTEKSLEIREFKAKDLQEKINLKIGNKKSNKTCYFFSII